MIDTGALEHTIITLILGLFGLLLGNFDAGICLGIGAFVMREITQNEYKYIEQQCPNRRRSEMPWYGGLIYGWDIGSIADCAAPALAGVVCMGLLHYFR